MKKYPEKMMCEEGETYHQRGFELAAEEQPIIIKMIARLLVATNFGLYHNHKYYRIRDILLTPTLYNIQYTDGGSAGFKTAI